MIDTAVGASAPLEDIEEFEARGEAMSDDDIVALLRHEIAQASSYQSTNVSQQRIDALKYYMGDYYGDEVEEQSKVVTTEVRDTIESILPQLIKLFLSTDQVVRFDPVGPEDEEAAEQATDYVNYIIQHDNDGFMLL